MAKDFRFFSLWTWVAPLLCLFVSLLDVKADDYSEMVGKLLAEPEQVSEFLKGNPKLLPATTASRLVSNDTSESSRALLALWLMGNDAYVELTWWRSNQPALRLLAAALLFTGRRENTSNVPFLDPSRFNSEERNLRMKELSFVEGADRALGEKLKRLVESTYTDNPYEWKNAMKMRFSGYGTPEKR